MMDAHRRLLQQHQQSTPSYEASPSRPTLGFPLGTALLLIVIFCLSGVLSCCYHWDKIQALRRRALGRGEDDQGDEENGGPADDSVGAGIPPPPSKPSLMDQYAKKERNESLPVIMPGDRIPKFIAWPCPCDLLPPSAAAPPRGSDVPDPQPDKALATSDELPSSTPPPPPTAAAVSCATSHPAGPVTGPAGREPTQLPLDRSVV